MGKNDFVSGSIMEFKVPKELGYAYCKVLDFRNIREFDGVLVKVYDLLVKAPIDDIKILAASDLLFGARRLTGLPNTRGKGAWKHKGVLVGEDDNIVPDFKYSQKYSALVEDESTLKEWYVMKNLTESTDIPCPYEKVRHLENTVVGSQYGIEIRTAMEFYRKNGWDIKSHFDFNELSNSNIYRMMINIPIYSTIPKDMRGKSLC